MIKQLDLKRFWEWTQLALRGSTGNTNAVITMEEVAGKSGVPLEYIKDNIDTELWDNPIYLAAVVETLMEIYGTQLYVKLYWVGDEEE